VRSSSFAIEKFVNLVVEISLELIFSVFITTIKKLEFDSNMMNDNIKDVQSAIIGTDEYEAMIERREQQRKAIANNQKRDTVDFTEWTPNGSCQACDSYLWHLWDPRRKLPIYCRGKFNP
jgi:hypothetical protein